MRKASILVWIILIVITILIAGGIFYYYQYVKTPELNNQISELNKQINQLQEKVDIVKKTANWQTYTNDEYKFSIKYPEGWVVRESDDGIEFISAGMLELIQKQTPDARADIFLSIFNNPQNWTLDEFIDDHWKEDKESIQSKESINIAGNSTVKIIESSMVSLTNYYWKKDLYIFAINTFTDSLSDMSVGPLEKVSEKIITTFQATD